MSIRISRVSAVLIAGMLCLPPSLEAQRVAAVGVDVDNDLFTTFDLYDATDYEYTHGVRLWLDLAGESARFIRVELGQKMYTPRRESHLRPLPGQRPHAGWSYASVSSAARERRVETEYELQIGVIGPPSLAEETQIAVHKLLGMRDPEGWDWQLPTTAVLQLRAHRSATVASTSIASVTPSLGYSVDSEVGNALVQTSAGVTTALCYKRSCGASEIDRNGRFSARLVATGGPRLVLHNVFLDGGVPRRAASVARRHVVWLGSVGAAVRWGRVAAEYEKVFRSREYETEPDGFSYGTFRLVMAR